MTPGTRHEQRPTKPERSGSGPSGGTNHQNRPRRGDGESRRVERPPAPDGAALAGADLSGAVFAGETLAGADLRNADLSGADLHRADLTGAHLDHATLAGANAREAVLSGASLYAVDLTGTDLAGVDLSDADLRSATITDANLAGADLGGANLEGATLTRANVVGADFTAADVRDVGYDDLEARRADVVELIAATLSTPHGPTRAEGISAAAAYADADPDRCRALVPELLGAIEAVALPSARITAIRTLAAIWMETGAVTRTDDRECARLLGLAGAVPVVRSVTVRNLAAVVVTYPHEFPETVSAFVELLSDDDREVRQTAMQTLAIVSLRAPEVTRGLQGLEREFEKLRRFPDTSDAEVDRALAMLRGDSPRSAVPAR